MEIGTCYVSDDFEEMGDDHVIVSRKHTGGRVSMAVYLVDIRCLNMARTARKHERDLVFHSPCTIFP